MGKNRNVKETPEGHAIRSNSLFLMAATLASRLLGIVRVRLVSTFYGGSGVADVINFAFSIPNNVRKLLAEGALSSAFIPVMTRVISSESLQEEKTAQKLISRIFGFQVLAILPIAIPAVFFPELLTKLLSDFRNPEQIEQAARMLRYFIIYLYCLSLASVVQAALHTRRSFISPAAAPLLFSTSVIIGVLLFASRSGEAAFRYGVVIGGFFHVGTLLPVFYRLGYRISFSFRFHNPDFIAVLKRFLPALSISLILVITQQVSIYLATALPSGGITAFSNSLVFYQMPYGVFYVSIATVFFPEMSRSYQKESNSVLHLNLNTGYQYIFVFLIPSMLLLFFLSEELVFSILQRGKFSPEDAVRTASSLKAFTPSLMLAGLFNFNQRFFYVTDRFRWAFYAILLYAFADITATVLSIEAGLDVYSFGIGSCAGYAAAMILQLFIIRLDKIPESYQHTTFRTLLKIGAANTPLLMMLILYRAAEPAWYKNGSTLRNFLILSGFGLVSLLLTLSLYRIGSIDFLYRKRRVR